MNGFLAALHARMDGFWLQRSAQERRTLTLAAGALVVMMGYQLVWTPVQQAVRREQVRLTDAQALARFSAQARTVLSRTKPAAVSQGTTALSPMIWVEQAARTMAIQDELVQRQPDGDDRVQLKFAAVPFDTLVRWLAQARAAGLQVLRADITPQSADTAHPAGRVDASLLLGRTHGS